MVGAFQNSILQLSYREDGLLDRVEGDRGAALDFDYHFPFLSLRRQGGDVPEENRLLESRIARVRCDPSSTSAFQVEYEYDGVTGALLEMRPSVGEPIAYGQNANDPGLIESIEVGGGANIPKQTIEYDDGTSLVTKSKLGSVEVVPLGAKVTLRERLDEGEGTVGAGGSLDVSYELDARGRVSGFANREFEFDERDQATKFEGAENGVDVVYDTANPVYRFRSNILRTERYSIKDSQQRYVTKTDHDQSAFNRIESITDIEGDERTFSYTGNPFGALTATESRGGAVVQTIEYNEFGQVETDSTVSAGANFERTASFGGGGSDKDLPTGDNFTVVEVTMRDNIGRLKSIGTPANTTTTSYDGAQLDRQDASNGDFASVVFTYDNLGRVEKESTTISAGSVSIEKSFDPTFPAKPATTKWTETGIPTSTAGYTYNGTGGMTGMVVDGDTTIFTVDGNGSVTEESDRGRQIRHL